MDHSRGIGEGGNFLSGEADRFASPEYGYFRICAFPDLEVPRLHSRIA